MSDTNGVSDNQNVGDDSQGDNNQQSADNQPTINPEDHKRALDDMHKFKNRWRESQDAMAKLQSELESFKKQQLTDKEDYKSLYEQQVEQNQNLKSSYDKLKGNLLHSERYRAVLPKLQQAGLRSEALKLIDAANLDDLPVEATSSGRFLVEGVDTFVEQFKQDYPFAFESKKPPRVDGGGGATNPGDDGKMTPAKLLEIEKQVNAGKLPRQKLVDAYNALAEQKKRA